MSGIAGILHLDGVPAGRADVERMLARLAHRGPDGAGVWSGGTVGFGHRLLHTTPESLRERLPLASADGSLVLTADARIDNRTDLCSVLRAPSSVTDAELLLSAYERWGERTPEHLLGDFAFAIWDERRQMLFCARDHFGVKPFYYHHRPDRLFAFASEIKGLLALPEIPVRLNETRVADYLLTLFEDRAITFYEDILRLPPAHQMTVARDGVRIEQYWALDPERELRLGSDAEYAAAFRELFTDAVRCRLRSAFPVGSLLSGGLDSSSVACTARALQAPEGGGPLPTFSALFDDVPVCDEHSFIDAVLAGGGFEAHYVRGDRLSPLADLDRVLDQQDEAFYAPNLFLHWGLYGAARGAGVRVLLDGLDGDSTVSHGLGRLAELARAGRWLTLARELRRLSRHFDASPWRFFRFYVARRIAPAPVRRLWRLLRGHRGPWWNPPATIGAAFARRSNVDARVRALRGDGGEAIRSERADHHRVLTQGLVPFALEVADRAAAAFGLEPRYPFFDKRLAEFCLALPADQKLRDGWTRFVLRGAMTGILPEAVRWRGGKSDLSPNFVRALLGAQTAALKEVVFGDAATIAPYVELGAVRAAWRRLLDTESEQDALVVWQVVTLALWLRRTGLAPNTRTERAPVKQTTSSSENAKEMEKRPYTTPRLEVHGTVEAITRKLTPGPGDAVAGSKTV